uniref:Cilia-and flagella-associated protein 96 n=1 Tax=Scleropages formosus TaxID=113540 RepID=A0A8C9S166_SCLFO
MPQEGKSDMERIGLFKEMGYISTGDKYVPFVYRPFNESAYKNKQILSSVPKKKCGLQVGYFESQYRRIFEGEAFADPGKLRRQYKMQQAKRNVGKAFLPSSGEQRPSGAGSYYGTLSGPVKAMSALQIARKPYKAPGKNFVTNPPKKGSGYGYPNVTLSKLESYSADPYDRTREILKREMRAHRSLMKGPAFHFNLHPMEYFDNNPYKADRPLPPMKNPEKIKASLVPFRPSSPGKRIGGMKAGTFEAYPSHSADAYGLKTSRAASVKKDGKVFHPSSGPKSMPVKSILDMNTIHKLK